MYRWFPQTLSHTDNLTGERHGAWNRRASMRHGDNVTPYCNACIELPFRKWSSGNNVIPLANIMQTVASIFRGEEFMR
jgi:hypothetical protein